MHAFFPYQFFQSSIVDIIFIYVECVCLLFSVSDLAPPLKKTKIVPEVMIEEGTKVNIVTSLLMWCWHSSYLGSMPYVILNPISLATSPILRLQHNFHAHTVLYREKTCQFHRLTAIKVEYT